MHQSEYLCAADFRRLHVKPEAEKSWKDLQRVVTTL